VLIRANALDLPIGDSTVDLVVTSPPYFALRSYQDGGEHYDGQIGAEATPGEFVDALLEATREMMRVLKPSGSIFVNLGDKYAGNGKAGISNNGRGSSSLGGGVPVRSDDVALGSGRAISTQVRPKSLIGVPWRYALRCIDDLGLILRAEIIWAKPNGLPESVTDRVSRKHEQWFHFTKEPRYYANIDAIREQYTAPPFRGQSTHKAGQRKATQNPVLATLTDWDASEYAGNPLGKMPGSWWNIPTEPLRVDPALGVDHFAAFPTEWPRRLILGWCTEGGTVLDPFGGTGTTAAVAKALGRTGISVDLSADYLRLADWRTNGPGYDKVVRKVTRSTSQPTSRPTGQLDMKELLG
jgi:site-specific DNA-methyltransferase (cytosine-N4-specific)